MTFYEVFRAATFVMMGAGVLAILVLIYWDERR